MTTSTETFHLQQVKVVELGRHIDLETVSVEVCNDDFHTAVMDLDSFQHQVSIRDYA